MNRQRLFQPDNIPDPLSVKEANYRSKQLFGRVSFKDQVCIIGLPHMFLKVFKDCFPSRALVTLSTK